MIEVSDSTLTYDLETKQKIYALAKIKEYWVLDLKNSQVIVFQQPENNRYLKQIKLTKGVISPLAFPDIEIDSQTISN